MKEVRKEGREGMKGEERGRWREERNKGEEGRRGRWMEGKKGWKEIGIKE